ncbi:hypothetical protein E8E14_008165 [Neopestalotiopsis sp. 37M]|nr:hypothetical protein E8E14_008165 [Neopestalotiopsis sp. 37M]
MADHSRKHMLDDDEQAARDEKKRKMAPQNLPELDALFLPDPLSPEPSPGAAFASSTIIPKAHEFCCLGDLSVHDFFCTGDECIINLFRGELRRFDEQRYPVSPDDFVRDCLLAMAEHLISRQGIQDDHVYSIAIQHVQKDQPGSLRLLRACGLIQYIMDDTFKHHMELLHEPLRFDDLDVIVDKTFPMDILDNPMRLRKFVNGSRIVLFLWNQAYQQDSRYVTTLKPLAIALQVSMNSGWVPMMYQLIYEWLKIRERYRPATYNDRAYVLSRLSEIVKTLLVCGHALDKEKASLV